MQSNVDKRQSNIELLRILSMFLVLMIHYIPFRGTPSPIALEGGENVGNTIFNLELRSLSFVCVNCFIIISGYFGIRWKWQSLLKYLYQILFWAIFAYFAPIILGYNQFNVPDLCFNLINFSSWNWFILSYLGLYLFAPMLECFIKNISQKQLSYFLLAFYCFSTIYGWILQVSPEFQEGTTFVSLIGLYLIGAYIRKYNLNVLRFKKIYDLLIYFGIGILLVILSVIALRFKITSSLYGYLNPLIIIESVYLFLFFKKLDIRYNKFINWVAASAFAVYLFHYNPNIFVFYSNICKYIQINFSYSFFAAILFMILIFIVAVLIDKIRIWSFNLIYKQITDK